MANSTTMTYGSYSFIPVPFVTINYDQNRAGDMDSLSSVGRISLNGTLTPLPTGSGGIINVVPLQDALRSGLEVDGNVLEIQCGGSTLFSENTRIMSFNFDPTPDNWVFSTTYNIEMEFDNWAPSGSGITDANDEWQFEFFDDKFFFENDLSGQVPEAKQYATSDYAVDHPPYFGRLTHNVSARAVRNTASINNPGWKIAESYVLGLIGVDSQHYEGSGVINLPSGSPFNHMRTRQVDEINGSYSVSESWVILDSGAALTDLAGNATEDFTATVRKSLESDFTTVSVEGSIQGLEIRDYGSVVGDFSTTTNKYDNASLYWSNISSRLLPRAQSIAEGVANRNLNQTALNFSVGHSPPQGTISYAYDYDDRPSNCITGSLSEIITMTDNNPADVFAQLTVLGRPAGPVLQAIGTKTLRTRDLNIEVVMAPSTGCTYSLLYGSTSTNPREQVKDNLLCPMEQEISGSQDQVFVQNDTETWNPKTGRYSRSVTWAFMECGDTTTPGACQAGTNMDVV